MRPEGGLTTFSTEMKYTSLAKLNFLEAFSTYVAAWSCGLHIINTSDQRKYTIVERILEEVNRCIYLFENRKIPFNSKLDDQGSGHSHCAIKVSFLSKSPLPLTGLQTECLHGQVTGLEYHTHSVHELPRFWYLQKGKSIIN